MPKTSSRSRVAVGLSLLSMLGCGGSVATLEFVSVTPPEPKIGEVATVRFKLTDYRGLPLAGQSVTFKLDADKPAVTLGPLSGQSQKGSGLIETQLVANGRVTAVRVIATAGDKEIISPAISFAGSASNGRQLTFQCGKISGDGSGGIHAIGAYDQSRHMIAGVKVPCIAHVADRNGDGLPGALVSFMAEAGTIGPSETSVADVLGNAEILYKSSLPFPKEVPPGVFIWNPLKDDTHTGEYLVPLWMEAYRWTTNPIATFDTGTPALNPNNLVEPRRPDPIRNRPDLVPPQPFQNNPRDNLVAMIAVTSGEEGFTDVNNNGTHDDGEPFDDLTEPFVDYDDNGTHDDDEKFIDTNGDGKWNGKNGQWDKNTLIWVQDRIIWTGIPNDEDVRTNARNPVPCVRGVQGVGGAPIQIACFDTVAVNFIIADPWWNSLARNNEGDGCKGDSNDVVEVVGGGHGAAFTYPASETYGFGLKDAMDRKPQPLTTPPQPGCFYPGYPGALTMCGVALNDCYNFGIGVECKFTASPLEGHKVVITGGVRGKIFKNLP